MAHYPGALWRPSHNFWPGRGGHAAQWLIIHGTAGPNAVSWLTSPDNKDSSAHFVITRDGVVYQLVDTDDSAWGNGVLETGHDPWWGSVNPNIQTISIEHEKLDTKNATSITDAQKKASFALINWLCNTHTIRKAPATAQGGITGHYSISPQSRAQCPGPFPWDDLWTNLGANTGGVVNTIPQGWHDDGTTLTAPNGMKVVHGFRDFVLVNGASWGKDNWPLENERAADPLEYSNRALGAGTQQIFRLCMLGWTKERGVIFENVGQELLAYRAMMVQYSDFTAKLQQQILALSQQLQSAGDAAKYKTILAQINTLTAPFGQ